MDDAGDSPDDWSRWWIIGEKKIVWFPSTHYRYVADLPEKQAIAEFRISPETYRKLQLRVKKNIGIGDKAAADLLNHNIRLSLFSDELDIQSKDFSDYNLAIVQLMMPSRARAAKHIVWETFSDDMKEFSMDALMSASSVSELEKSGSELGRYHERW